MTLATTRFCTILGLGWLAFAPAASASDWSALVIGREGADDFQDDAGLAAQALQRAGLTNVNSLDPTVASLHGALENLAGQDRVLIYYSGAIGGDGAALSLNDGAQPLAGILQQLQAAGTSSVALLIEDCPAGISGAPALTLPSAPEGMDLAVMASAGPDGQCPGASQRLTDRLVAATTTSGATDSLQQMLQGVWGWSPNDFLVTLTPLPGDDSAAGLSRVSNDVISLSPAVTTAAPAETVTLARLGQADIVQPEYPDNTPAGAVVIFPAPANVQLAALPRDPGLPEPAIIVGVLPSDQGRAQQPDLPLIAYNDVQARRNLRAEDPQRFEDMVAAGALDPPAADMARALQVELERMECYTSSIDGIWGNGSRGAVRRYFEQPGTGTAESLEPVAALFRQILRKDDVVCPPPPRVAVTPPATTRTTTTTRRTTPATTTRREQPAPVRTQPVARSQPQPQPAQPTRRINSGGALGGVYR